MKRTLIAAAAVLAAGTAFAQSSVQIYGRVNTSVERQKLGDVTTTVMQNNASRWGLRGSEDMGGGLKGLFVLESGFNSDNGALTQAGALFGREACVWATWARRPRTTRPLTTSACTTTTPARRPTR
jgi:predicted porin